MNRHAGFTTVVAMISTKALCAASQSCDLLGRKPIYRYDQAIEIADEIISQSFGILPRDTGLSDLAETYAGESTDYDSVSGTARLYGGYDYSYDDLYIDSNSHKVVRSWEYDDLQILYDGYQRFDRQVTIVSGELTADGTVGSDTRYTSTTYSSYSSTTESGSIRVTGTVVVDGVSEGKEVHDTVRVDLTKSLTGDTWFYNGRISNPTESWYIVMQ